MTSGVRNRRGTVRRAGFLEHTRNMDGDRVGADEQRLRNVLVGLAAGEQLQDLELTRGQTGGIARQPQSIAFAKRRNTLTKQDQTERGGYLLAFIEQRRRLRPVVAGADCRGAQRHNRDRSRRARA